MGKHGWFGEVARVARSRVVNQARAYFRNKRNNLSATPSHQEISNGEVFHITLSHNVHIFPRRV
jgi:hypothetical protein